MPADCRDAWMCYRLVVEQRASWTEVTTTMSIDDVEKLFMALVACEG